LLLYLDTSILLSLHLNDAKTQAVTLRVRNEKYNYAISSWCLTETASALGILVRRKDVSTKLATEVLKNVELLAAECRVLPVDANAFRLLNAWLSHFNLGLRAGDALHAAICKAITKIATSRKASHLPYQRISDLPLVKTPQDKHWSVSLELVHQPSGQTH
jgi:uncharacterized protein